MKLKRAYVLTRTAHGFPELAAWRDDELNAYCKKSGYVVVGGTKVTGAMTKEFGEQIIENAKSLHADVVMTFNGRELGCDMETALPFIGNLRNAGMEVETMVGKIPDKLTVSMILAFGDVIQDMRKQEAAIFGEDEDMEEEGAEAYVVPDPVIEHWEVDSQKVHEDIQNTTNKAGKTCVLYTRVGPDNFFCDELTPEEQEELLQAKATEKGYSVMEKIRTEDDGLHKNSAGLHLLQRYITNREIDAVLVTGYDAFSDDALLCKDIVDDLKRKGVEVEAVQECSLRISANEFFRMS